MENICLIFTIAGIFCMKACAYFMTVVDFGPSELANLTLQQRHQLMLQKLPTKELSVLASAFYYELLSINAGGYFFGFAQDESVAQANNAIVKAAFGCLKNLQIQNRAEQLLSNVSNNGAFYAKTFGNVSFAFSLTCADLDSSLANETQYTILRDKFKKKPYALPIEVYHYNIAERSDDEIDAIDKLVDEPAIKLFLAHQMWVHTEDSEDSKVREIKQAVLELVKEPEKLLQVQKLYDQSIDELIPQIGHPSLQVARPWAGQAISYLQPALAKILWNKITENIPDWTDYFECIPSSDENAADSSLGHSKPGTAPRCEKIKVKPGSGLTSDKIWPVTTDFDPFVLQNKTLEQKHNLFLQELAKKHIKLIEKLMFIEILAKSIGNDFFGFVEDAEKNVVNNAICRAAVECISSLRLQTVIRDLIPHFTKMESEYVKKTGDFSEGFNRVCSKLDTVLSVAGVYSRKKFKYIKENVRSPKKIYQYSIGEPTDDQREIIADLYSDPRIVNYFFHFFWSITNIPLSTPEDVHFKFMIYELAKIPSQAESIQNMYEQSVSEISPLIKRFSPTDIFKFANTAKIETLVMDVKELILIRLLIADKMVKNIQQNPSLFAIFAG